MRSRPGCFDECAALLARRALESGSEVHVQQMPADGLLVVHPDFPPFVATCPHGITWVAEPTGEQIAEWVRTKAP